MTTLPSDAANWLARLSGAPLEDDEPVFSAQWEAKAFLLVLGLIERGAFSEAEWRAALARRQDVRKAKRRSNLSFYEAWLKAAEDIIMAKAPSDMLAMLERCRRLAAHGDPSPDADVANAGEDEHGAAHDPAHEAHQYEEGREAIDHGGGHEH